MSNINCDSCANLREYAPEFVQNGVTSRVSTSLKNNTGFNPSLSVLHENCEDLNDANDCLIGRLPQELAGYDVCEWKEFMGKLLPNQYEMLKALIAGDCGQWKKLDLLCNITDTLLDLINGGGPTRHARGYWTDLGRSQFTKTAGDYADEDLYYWSLPAEIRSGATCSASGRLGLMANARIAYPVPAGDARVYLSYTMTNFSLGDAWAYFRKEDVVGAGLMTESFWNTLMLGRRIMSYSVPPGMHLYVRHRGYIVYPGDGREYNEDLKNTFGPDVLVVEPARMVGGGSSSTFSLPIPPHWTETVTYNA